MKKKMKKIFSKITTLVLLVAMLIPYTSIPKVEAATDSCDGVWEYHTNYYFFTQAEHPRTWANYLATVDGNNTDFSTDDKTSNTYYTSFLYDFPSDGSTLDITSAGFVDLDMDGNVSKIKSTSEWSVKGFYSELLKMYDSSNGYDYANETSTYKQYSYTASNGSGISDNDSVITYFIHGPWGFVGTGNNLSSADTILQDKSSIISVNSYNKSNNSSANETTIIEALKDASVLPANNNISSINIGVASGGLGTDDSSIASIKSAISNYNRDKGTSAVAGIYKATRSTTSSETTGDIVLKLYIRRSYNTNDFFDFNDIRIQTIGKNYMASSSTSADDVNNLGDDDKLYFPEIDSTCDTGRDDCNDQAYVTKGNGSTTQVSKATAVKLRDGSTDEYWFLAPSLFQISYKVCRTSNTSEDQVALSYDGNAPKGIASNIPGSVIQTTGTDFVVSSNVPTLDGYKFKSWNTKSSCDGTTVDPETTLENLTNNTTLFACWGETGTTSNKKTGVATYAGLFTGIIALAGGSYYLIKKKNLFKKI